LDQLEERIRHLIVETLNLEDIKAADIDPEEILFGDGLGLDSIDALEIGVEIQKVFGIKNRHAGRKSRELFFERERVGALRCTTPGATGAGGMSRDEIYEKLKEFMVELFEIPVEQIGLDAELADDLDLDSIDAVDLILKLQEFTGRKVSAEQFRTVRTVRDVIDQVHELLGQAA